MAGFADVALEWNGAQYKVPADRVMRLVVQLEDILAGDGGENALDVLMNKRPPARIAAAYEAALNYAGADLAPGEVYLALMQSMAEGRADHLRVTMDGVMAILALIAPPVHSRIMAAGGPGGSSEKK